MNMSKNEKIEAVFNFDNIKIFETFAAKKNFKIFSVNTPKRFGSYGLTDNHGGHGCYLRQDKKI